MIKKSVPGLEEGSSHPYGPNSQDPHQETITQAGLSALLHINPSGWDFRTSLPGASTTPMESASLGLVPGLPGTE